MLYDDLVKGMNDSRKDLDVVHRELVAREGETKRVELLRNVFNGVTDLVGIATEKVGMGKEKARYIKDMNGLFERGNASVKTDDIERAGRKACDELERFMDSLTGKLVRDRHEAPFYFDEDKSFKGKKGSLKKKVDELRGKFRK